MSDGYYAISVQIETVSPDGKWHGSRGVPTFYLHKRVQMIISEEHAALIAADIVNPLGEIPPERIHVSAVRI